MEANIEEVLKKLDHKWSHSGKCKQNPEAVL